MFRKTFTGSLVAASLTAGALMTLPSASAAPTWVDQSNISQLGLLPKDADVAMSENGNAVATWIREALGADIVYASYSTGGSWSVPDSLTYTSDTIANPTAVINDKGEAAVTWLEEDNGGEMRVAVSRYIGGGVFDGRSLMSHANDLNATAPLSVDMDGAGTVYAARTDSDGGDVNKVRVSTLTKGGALNVQTLSDNSSFAPDLAVSNAGRAVVSWYNAGDGTSTIDVRSRAAGSNTWLAADSTSLAGAYQVRSDVAIDGDNAVVAYTRQDLENNYRVWANKILTDGTVTSATIVSAEDQSASNVSVDINAAGFTLAAWSSDDGADRVRYATRPYAGSWSGGTLVGELAASTTPDVVVSDSGLVAIGYPDAGHQHVSYRQSPFQLMTNVDSAGGFVNGETAVGADSQGNVLLTGIVKMPDPTQGFVNGAILDVAGASTTMTAPGSITLGTKASVAWKATDRFSALGTANVRVRSAAFNGGFGAHSFLTLNTPSTSLLNLIQPGRTYCYSVQTKDANNTTGAFSGEKCTTTPVDDRKMTIAKGFKRAKAGSSYLGTYSIAKKKNAVMTLKNVKAKKIAILVTKVAKGGKVQVFFAGKKLGTYSLKGTGNKKYIAAKTFSSVKTGNLVIKVISKKGKVVRIDGMIAVK
ncbi:hypothetical protein EFK50_09985 [Nocardioides marmoriginsengisoli]|uniref:Fibronectin type-III domain-containing protein n=1 Tax=Nocardioides marmoriginsengisoli TaxID=661483 RepID=A0A3N0CGI5_9ACTN|nr:hypothetical protein [Nocardioides marmoriginsengisoli]RNL62126.1 hypothetical protein EFK50_09985 [Nocardioides marmoriginsengisoli]